MKQNAIHTVVTIHKTASTIITANINSIYLVNTTSSTTSTANTYIIHAIEATMNTNLAQQNESDDEEELACKDLLYRSAPKAGKLYLSGQNITII